MEKKQFDLSWSVKIIAGFVAVLSVYLFFFYSPPQPSPTALATGYFTAAVQPWLGAVFLAVLALWVVAGRKD